MSINNPPTAMTTFSVGDVVMLNSGSPLLTVTDLSKDKDRVFVEWYDDDEGMVEADFSSACVKMSEYK